MNAMPSHPPATTRAAGTRALALRAAAHGQRGAVVIVFSMVLVVILVMFGLALDLGQLYNRKAELQSIADAAALAAARELVGTQAGVTAAVSKAVSAVSHLKYQYNQMPVSWSDSAIQFSASPTAAAGDWLDAGAAKAAPDGLLFVKVDTGELDAAIGAVNTLLMRLVSPAYATINASTRAIAGRSTINVMPLAVCAQSATAAAARTNSGAPAKVELVEYGFRRGVAYDLMKLNPNGSTAENFVIDPIDALGTLGSSANMTAAVVGPLVCTGSMPMTRVSGASITVGRPFPLASLAAQFNARFDQYTGNLCKPNAAPPDLNIKGYNYSAIPWMSTAPAGQTAVATTGTPLWTVADPLTPLPTSATQYGPLWSFAKAVPFSAYTPGVPEPAAGYTPFSTADWATLYKPGAVANGYPASTLPYLTGGTSYSQAPSAAHAPGQRNRRVLNVALLSCPVAAGGSASANVLAIGKFFMTVPATGTSLSAEFGGLVPEQSLGGQVELYQ